MAAPIGSPDVIGVGALNLDLIASASKLSLHLSEKVVETTARFEWNVEGTVEEDAINRVLAGLGPSSIDGALGGSAWNTIYSLAQMGVGVSVGYVGVAGRTEFPGLSFIRQMDLLKIDHRFVRRIPERRSGLCLSYIEDGERVLLTTPGVNLEMEDYVKQEFPALVHYLCSARAIHVTSFLDSGSTAQVAELLTEVKRRSPRTILSVDPGHVWATDLSASVRQILGCADYLFCNHREFKILAEYRRGETDSVLAGKIFDSFGPTLTLVVAKRYDLVEIFRGRGARMVVVSSPKSSVGPLDRDIEDATGAGDTFAAAVLAALTSTKLQTNLGSLVGLALSRYKRAGTKISKTAIAPSLDKGFLLFPELTNIARTAPRRIFLAYGPSPEWEKMYTFLAHDGRISVDTFDAGDVEQDSESSSLRITQWVEQCGFAVCILVDAKGSSGSRAANQQVLQYAGAFQGRYGFERVALVVEEGCEVLSNVAGLIRLEYPRGDIERVFWQLEQMLRREGVTVGHSPIHEDTPAEDNYWHNSSDRF